MQKRKISSLILGIVISAALLIFLFSQIKISSIIEASSKIPFFIILVSFFIYLLSLILKAARFNLLLNNRVPFLELNGIVFVHNIMNIIMPARTGEFSYIYLIKKKGIKVSEGTSTLLIARAFDLIAIFVLFLISIILSKDIPYTFLKSLLFISPFILVLTLILIFLIYCKNLIIRLIYKFVGAFRIGRFRFVNFLFGKLYQVIENFRVIKSKKKILSIFVFSFVIWLLQSFLLFLLVRGMGIDISFFSIVIVSTFTFLVSILPINSFFGFGTVEGFWALAWVLLGLNKELAISSGFVQHIFFIVFSLILGSFGLILLKTVKVKNKNKKV